MLSINGLVFGSEIDSVLLSLVAALDSQYAPE
jgi:hypothetical protein